MYTSEALTLFDSVCHIMNHAMTQATVIIEQFATPVNPVLRLGY